MGEKFRDFIKNNSEVFALILGLVVFYNFTEATNPAVKSFLWLFSSFLIIVLFIYLSALAFLKGKNTTRFFIGLPLSLIGLSLTLQIVISLFEPQNEYSLNLIKSAFSKNMLLLLVSFILYAIALTIFMILLQRIIVRRGGLSSPNHS